MFATEFGLNFGTDIKSFITVGVLNSHCNPSLSIIIVTSGQWGPNRYCLS